MAKNTRGGKQGMSPAGKAAILLVLFGVPALFFASSYGLSKLFDVAPLLVLAIVVIVATAYTAYTVHLMYTFYQVDAPVVRFIPCLCEVALMDLKYQKPCYVLYPIAVVFGLCSQLPYAIWSRLGEQVAFSAPFYCILIALVLLGVIQAIKGVGLMSCLRDIAEAWDRIMHTDPGAITKFGPLCFIPFVRVVALYSVNKPLSTMVSFMGVSADAGEVDSEEFAEED